MSNSTIRQISLAFLLSAFVTAPSITLVQAAPSDTPSPPASDTKSKPKDKKKDDRKSSIDSPAFLQGYRAAYATIYERSQYAAAIDQLKALGQDDRADVANLIGYSYRKLGNYELASVWYERALKADPNHVRTWQYYGLWQIEQGNRDQAMYHLGKIEKICGKGCAEYQSLAQALTTGQTTY